MPSKVQDKHGEPIRPGDEVYTPIRGGKHQGNVEEIVTSEQEAKDAGVKNPPKVLFTDQNDKAVAHNPGTLEHVQKG